MKLYRQSDRRKTPAYVEVRPMTKDEILNLGYGCHVGFILNNGRLGEVKINGAVKTWKRDANRVEVPVKYGMYEFGRLSLDEALARFVVEHRVLTSRCIKLKE